jgi:hypothetical protein
LSKEDTENIRSERGDEELNNSNNIEIVVSHQAIPLTDIGISPAGYIIKEIVSFSIAAGIGVAIMLNMRGGFSGAIIGALLVYLVFVIWGIIKTLRGKNSRHTETCISIRGISGYQQRLENWLAANGFTKLGDATEDHIYVRDTTPSMVIEYLPADDSLILKISLRDAMSGQLFDIGQGVYGALVRPKARALANDLLQSLSLEAQSF